MSGPLNGVRVLVVEDERGVRLLVSRVLRDAGAEVTAVGTISEALREFERTAPDVLVSDIRMPGGDGYDLIRRVRALPRERGGRVPAVAISASVSEDEIPRILAAGFQKFIRKPFKVAEVRSAVVSLAGRSAS